MSIYLDTSVLVPLIVPDIHTARAEAFMESEPTGLIVSDFAAAEFASSVARLVRMSEMSEDEAATAFSAFDGWVARTATRVPVLGEDIRAAEASLRRLDARLTTPDMLHVVVAQRLVSALATFDERLRDTAQMRGVPVLAF